LESFFGKVLFIAFFIRDVSFAAVVNGKDRSVGEAIMLRSISGSESTDVENF